jgi:hypothetical protein
MIRNGSQENPMDTVSTPSESARIIDLTRATDVQFWCRIFDVSMDQLRDAVHHAGHQVEEVGRYLRHKKEAGR